MLNKAKQSESVYRNKMFITKCAHNVYVNMLFGSLISWEKSTVTLQHLLFTKQESIKRKSRHNEQRAQETPSDFNQLHEEAG